MSVDHTSPISGLVRTFLIADVRGYTQFTYDHGDEAAARLANRFAVIAGQIVTHHGGEVTELRGDEALAVFESPRAAIRAALDLQGRFLEEQRANPLLPLKVGMGLDAGEAIPVQGGYRGGALNFAARLCSLAGPGEIFASEGVIHLARNMDDVVYLDRGEVQLKGLPHPVHVVQVLPEGANLEDVAKFTVQVKGSHNLPPQSTRFIGREEEVALLAEMLRSDDVRLVTLTGPGGTGKSRLSLQVASEMLDVFPDGIVFVSLAPITDSAVVPSTIAAACGLLERDGLSASERLSEYVATKRLLLVLDNFEHMLDASSLVSDLLVVAPALKALVTSREVLHLSSEHEYPVAPLAIPDLYALPDVDTLSRFDSIQLFIQRADAVKPGFTVTNDNAHAIAEICFRLDGLPLAIELAAARLKIFPPHALLARLSSRLKLLTGGARDAPTRQHTLKGTIDWSYKLLTEDEQKLFTRLSVFQGGCSFEAADAVCTAAGDLDIEVLDGVSSLVDKSLLRREGEMEPRFLMLETIREFAAEKSMEAGDKEQVRDSHAAYFLELAEDAEPELNGHSQAAWLQRLEEEHDNLRAALTWLLERRKTEHVLRIASALRVFWHVRCHFSEGRRWIEAGLEPGDTMRPAVRMKALHTAAILAMVQADRIRALSFANQLLTLAQEEGDRYRMSMALTLLGMTALQQGDTPLAVSYLEESLVIARARDNPAELANSLYNLGLARSEEGSYSEALSLIEEAQTLFVERGMTFWTMNARGALVYIALLREEYRQARDLLTEYMEMAQQLQDKASIAAGLEASAVLAAEDSSLQSSAHLFASAAALRAEIGGRLMSHRNRTMVEQRIDWTRERLGETEWAAAWKKGQSMSLENTIAHTLERNPAS